MNSNLAGVWGNSSGSFTIEVNSAETEAIVTKSSGCSPLNSINLRNIVKQEEGLYEGEVYIFNTGTCEFVEYSSCLITIASGGNKIVISVIGELENNYVVYQRAE